MKKETLVLIPGFGANEKAWEHQASHLSAIADVQIIIMDNQSSRAEMVNHLLSLAPERFILAGQSMGGWVAEATAAKAPQRVSKLILLNTWCSPNPKMNAFQKLTLEALLAGYSKQVIDQNIQMVVHPDRLNDTPFIDGIKNMIGSFSPQVLARQMQAMLDDYDSLSFLDRITQPTLLIHGKQDLLFPTEEQHILSKNIKNSRLAVIEDCGHASLVERPQAVTALMRYFIEY